jgi:hypothetical protein
MPKRSHQPDPIAAAKRRSVATRRVGIGSRCVNCGEGRPLSLIPESKPTTCEECRRRRKSRKACDDHHIAGKANHSFTIPIPANDHRAVLSEAQYDWPKATRENPHRSPLIAIAGCIRGCIDTIVYLLKKMLSWAAEFVEQLDAFLVFHMGPNWWTSHTFVEFIERGLYK